MKVWFQEQDHRYFSDPPIQWTSSTKVVEQFVPEFNDWIVADRCRQKSSSKWYGISTDEIVDIWRRENKRSTDTGSLFHLQQELKAIKQGFKYHRGVRLPVINIPFLDGKKEALNQQLNPGCYLEHIIYDEYYKVCGQTDIMLTDGEYLDVMDYKTNKEIKFKNPWQTMLWPLGHLDDCNYIHYIIQCSIYMYLALQKNPHLKPGTIKLIHIDFKVLFYDQYGFPTIEMDADGYPIISAIQTHEIPYAKYEVEKILQIIKDKK